MLRLVLPAMPTHWTRAWVAAWACSAAMLWGHAQAGTNPADPAKVLHLAFPVAETGFDPVRVSDLYSNIVNSGIFQPLVTYDWMARPSTIVPNAAEALPEITDDGKLYTFKVRKGLYFSADPAFKGQKRELTAQDFVYTLLRHIDPKNKSPRVADLEDKIEGFAAARRQAAKEGMNYEQRHPGIYASDRYTLHIRLVRADRNFLTLLSASWRIRWAPGRICSIAGCAAPKSSCAPTRLTLALPGTSNLTHSTRRTWPLPQACRGAACRG